jgi:hypothetical protein
MEAGQHHEFWRRHPGLVWSNPDADDSVRIRAALIRPQFRLLLDIAVEFGLDRVRSEWLILLADQTPGVQRAQHPVERIFRNIQEGFDRAFSRN